MKTVHTQVFNDIKYNIDLEEIEGLCGSGKEKPTIRLPNGLPYGNSKRAKLGLVTLLHESLHASDWNMIEDKVDRIAKEIGNLLWRLNYRRKKV